MKMTLKNIFLSCSLAIIANVSLADVMPKTKAPDFTLKDLTGKEVKLSQFKDKWVVLEWFNKDCPYVKKHYSSSNMQNLQKEYTAKDVVWLTINSSAPGKQGNESNKDALKTLENFKAAQTHYLVDDKGVVGKLYGAKTTPHIYIISPDNTVVYTGAIDDNSSSDPADIATSKNYVRVSLDAAMNGKAVETQLTKPYGCTVKY